MDLFLWVKGIKPHVQKWENDLMAQWCNTFENGKPDGNSMQLSVEPIQLYTIRFPEEELDRVLNVVGIETYLEDRYKIIKIASKWLRKILGLKPVPKPKNPVPQMQPHNLFKAVAVNPIGLKKERFIDGKEFL